GALNANASRLARRLTDRGIDPEDLVGVALERGPDMIVALLGVLKAGAAYLPLDAGHPAGRLRFMLAGAPLLITAAGLSGRLAAWPGDGLVTDRAGEGRPAGGRAAEGAGPRVAPGNLAYVIFTSGSTGAPKGFMVSRRSMTLRLRDMAGRYGLT